MLPLTTATAPQRAGPAPLPVVLDITNGKTGAAKVTYRHRDGTQAGFDTDLLRAISDAVEVPVIASGGAAGQC